MTDDRFTDAFERSRPRLRAVAYRMLGSLTEADDAVQETWLRLDRADADAIGNLDGWLTTVTARICLDMLRSRAARREEHAGMQIPDPVVRAADEPPGPEDELLLADAVGLALLVVLETLAPPERLAFVLHDMFGLPFAEIAPLVGRTPEAARQLASRARRRVRRDAPAPDADRAVQRRAVDAFLAAARDGDFAGLVAILDPDAELHVGGRRVAAGAAGVATHALETGGARFARFARPVLVNGTAGAVVARGRDGRVVLGFTVRAGRVVRIDILG